MVSVKPSTKSFASGHLSPMAELVYCHIQECYYQHFTNEKANFKEVKNAQLGREGMEDSNRTISSL